MQQTRVGEWEKRARQNAKGGKTKRRLLYTLYVSSDSNSIRNNRVLTVVLLVPRNKEGRRMKIARIANSYFTIIRKTMVVEEEGETRIFSLFSFERNNWRSRIHLGSGVASPQRSTKRGKARYSFCFHSRVFSFVIRGFPYYHEFVHRGTRTRYETDRGCPLSFARLD